MPSTSWTPTLSAATTSVAEGVRGRYALLGPRYIRVNCIIPGWIRTERQLTRVTPEAEESIVRNQCLPDKVYPDDVARLLLWLAADDSRACTAQRWIVDGGCM
jgi:D-xylose 1-dehydrogenase